MQPPSHLRHRPLGISILACIHWLTAAFMLLLFGFALTREPSLADIVIAGMLGLFMALIAWIGFGLWQLKLKTYRLVIALNIISIVGQLIKYGRDLSAIPSTIEPFGLIFCLVVLLYLRRKAVRTAFVA